MLLILISLSWTLSIIFMFLNHPLSFGMIILLQTIIISISTGILNFDYWFSYILFLIMVGGMLVLFIYMTSIASNEKFKFSYKLTLLILIFSMMMMILLFTDNFFSMISLSNTDLMSQPTSNINLSMNKYMNLPNMLIMLLMMLYLLITLIAIVKITQLKMGPLRQTNS